jgi:thiamine-phosphate pyrophosphorylase
MWLCYITDRHQFPGGEDEQRRSLLARIGKAARAGIDFIQLREKDLCSRELESLAREAVAAVREHSGHSRLLINSRTDIALAAGAHGLHLRSDDIPANEARAIWAAAQAARSSGATTSAVISVSCHTATEVLMAAAHGADFALFAPVFEKAGQVAAGLHALAIASRQTAPAGGVESSAALRMPVLALGGVTTENASACLESGAAGIAGIRMFQQGNVEETVAELRKMSVPFHKP